MLMFGLGGKPIKGEDMMPGQTLAERRDNIERHAAAALRAGEPLISTYTIETVIGRNGYTIELIATSEKAAISRARGTMFHGLQDVEALTANYVITDVTLFDDVTVRKSVKA